MSYPNNTIYYDLMKYLFQKYDNIKSKLEKGGNLFFIVDNALPICNKFASTDGSGHNRVYETLLHEATLTKAVVNR